MGGKRILGLLAEGLSVGLCTDGGYPALSDPGYRIITAALEAGHTLDVLPGASSIPVALLLSGLPTSSYTFKGFPPRKPGPRRRFLEMDAALPHTLVFFESPYRVKDFLSSALDTYGNRKTAICSELTKKYQRIERGTLSELVAAYDTKAAKGEITIVVAGKSDKVARPQGENGLP